jgi:hypothetical protein
VAEADGERVVDVVDGVLPIAERPRPECDLGDGVACASRRSVILGGVGKRHARCPGRTWDADASPQACANVDTAQHGAETTSPVLVPTGLTIVQLAGAPRHDGWQSLSMVVLGGGLVRSSPRWWAKARTDQVRRVMRAMLMGGWS